MMEGTDDDVGAATANGGGRPNPSAEQLVANGKLLLLLWRSESCSENSTKKDRQQPAASSKAIKSTEEEETDSQGSSSAAAESIRGILLSLRHYGWLLDWKLIFAADYRACLRAFWLHHSSNHTHTVHCLTLSVPFSYVAIVFRTRHAHNTTLTLPVKRAVQYWLDKSTIHLGPRWIGFAVLLAIFFLRVYLVQGYFIVAYGLGIYLLNNFIAFLSPLEDPSTMGGAAADGDDDGPTLPTSAKEGKEFRPFARRLPEFKFWLACAKGVLYSIGMTFFSRL